MPDALWYAYLPDGMHDVTADGMGGLYISGFDSQRRVCLVLFAPPYGQPLRTISTLPYRDYGRYTPTVLTARDPMREHQLYVLLYLHPDNLGISQTTLYRLDLNNGNRRLLATMSARPQLICKPPTHPICRQRLALPCAQARHSGCRLPCCLVPTRRSSSLSVVSARCSHSGIATIALVSQRSRWSGTPRRRSARQDSPS